MICRREYRGCLQTMADEEKLKQALIKANNETKNFIKAGGLLQASLYRFQNMCFLYCEAEGDFPQPENFLAELSPFLEDWPEEKKKRKWAYMYPIYYHSIPVDKEEWRSGRIGKKQVGRIAFLKKEKWASYVYWHKALVEEGLFCGDQYQFISLHENILFSYFEEPKKMVNIRRTSESSMIIEGWLNSDPKSHFCRNKTGGENFYIMEQLLSAGKEGEPNDF